MGHMRLQDHPQLGPEERIYSDNHRVQGLSAATFYPDPFSLPLNFPSSPLERWI